MPSSLRITLHVPAEGVCCYCLWRGWLTVGRWVMCWGNHILSWDYKPRGPGNLLMVTPIVGRSHWLEDWGIYFETMHANKQTYKQEKRLGAKFYSSSSMQESTAFLILGSVKSTSSWSLPFKHRMLEYLCFLHPKDSQTGQRYNLDLLLCTHFYAVIVMLCTELEYLRLNF